MDEMTEAHESALNRFYAIDHATIQGVVARDLFGADNDEELAELYQRRTQALREAVAAAGPAQAELDARIEKAEAELERQRLAATPRWRRARSAVAGRIIGIVSRWAVALAVASMPCWASAGSNEGGFEYGGRIRAADWQRGFGEGSCRGSAFEHLCGCGGHTPGWAMGQALYDLCTPMPGAGVHFAQVIALPMEGSFDTGHPDGRETLHRAKSATNGTMVGSAYGHGRERGVTVR